jgi:hypothetical protein
MRSDDHLGTGRDELFEAGSLRHASAEEERAHPAVDKERTSGEAVPEPLTRQTG